jgi:hypothetical protein
MKRKRHSPAQILVKLREVDSLLAGGTTLADAPTRLGVQGALAGGRGRKRRSRTRRSDRRTLSDTACGP